MWNLSHFNQLYSGNGTIRNVLAGLPEVANAVANQDPYVNGQQSHLDDTPPSGAQVTFRPRMSGKAQKRKKEAALKRRIKAARR